MCFAFWGAGFILGSVVVECCRLPLLRPLFVDQWGLVLLINQLDGWAWKFSTIDLASIFFFFTIETSQKLWNLPIKYETLHPKIRTHKVGKWKKKKNPKKCVVHVPMDQILSPINLTSYPASSIYPPVRQSVNLKGLLLVPSWKWNIFWHDTKDQWDKKIKTSYLVTFFHMLNFSVWGILYLNTGLSESVSAIYQVYYVLEKAEWFTQPPSSCYWLRERSSYTIIYFVYFIIFT